MKSFLSTMTVLLVLSLSLTAQSEKTGYRIPDGLVDPEIEAPLVLDDSKTHHYRFSEIYEDCFFFYTEINTDSIPGFPDFVDSLEGVERWNKITPYIIHVHLTEQQHNNFHKFTGIIGRFIRRQYTEIYSK